METGPTRPEAPDALAPYRARRDPGRTPEPEGRLGGGGPGDPVFVVQRHVARRLHYDLRLERDGVLASWAVPRGMPLRPGDRGLAVRVEDHPMAYRTFAGEIPAGEYGAGRVEVWDHGTYRLLRTRRDGGMTVRLAGERLRGTWALTPAGLGGDPDQWLVIRKREDDGRPWPDERYRPMLATLAEEVPAGPGWRHEVKWDGFRAVARLRGGEASMWSRTGQDLGERFAPLLRALERGVRSPECVLDGEACALTPAGAPSFGLLQRGEGRLVLYLFDVLEVEGVPVLDRPWHERRALLRELVDTQVEGLTISEDFPDGRALLAAARAQGLEGVVAKREDAPYRPGRRSPEWVKVKVHGEDDLVIAGFRRGRGSRGAVGALVMGRPGEGGGLVWAGNVGSGFTEAALRDLLGRLGPLVTPDPPLSDWTRVPGARRGEVTWVAPRLRGRVRFAEWTRDRVMRAPVWQGLLEDAPAPAPPAAPAAPPARRVRITNRDKPYFPEEGITKGDLVDYYRAIAPALVPHLRERPFTMIRRPDGIAGAHFFQKDRPPHMPDWIPVAPLPSGSGPGHRVIRFPVVNDADALVWMANAGCVDMNHWYSRRDMPGHPDYVLFDLDPAEGSGFREAVRVALLVREVLGLLGLVGYAKTSSARGLHVMVPVDRVHTFEEARAFCRLVGSALEQTHRGLVTTEWAKERRRGVLVDANQVAYAKTISSVYSVRPRPGAPVSTPLEWDEVDEELDPRELTMAVALDRVQRRGDLFAPVLAGGQRLGPAIARIRGANP